jgi:hypothetical protein
MAPEANSKSRSSRGKNGRLMNCLYLYARSLVRKMDELQTLSTDMDLFAVTETWPKPDILDCELLPGLGFTIHRRDIIKTGGGVMLAIRNSLHSLRRQDLKCNSKTLVCKLRPEGRRKLAIIVPYRPPNSDTDYLK